MFENPFPTVFLLKGNKRDWRSQGRCPRTVVVQWHSLLKSFQMQKEKVKGTYMKVIYSTFKHSTSFSRMLSLPRRAQPGPWTKAKQREGMLFKLLHASPDTHHLATILNEYLHSPFTDGELEVQSSNRICWGSGRYGIWIQVSLTPPSHCLTRGSWATTLDGGVRSALPLRRKRWPAKNTSPEHLGGNSIPWASSLKTSWWQIQEWGSQ